MRPITRSAAQEFPRIGKRRFGQRHRYAYTVSVPPDGDPQFSGATRLYKHDLETGERRVHAFGAGRVPDEFVFVPAGSDTGEDDGPTRDLALFNTVIDSKLRGCDLVRLRTTVVQQETGRPVPFELTETTRETLAAWLEPRGLRAGDSLFPSRSRPGEHLTTRRYGRLVDE